MEELPDYIDAKMDIGKNVYITYPDSVEKIKDVHAICISEKMVEAFERRPNGRLLVINKELVKTKTHCSYDIYSRDGTLIKKVR